MAEGASEMAEDHSPSRDEGREHDPRTSNSAQDDKTQTGESSTSRSTGAVRGNMTHIDMDNSLKSAPVPKKNQTPQIPSYLNDTRDHSPSRDEGREHDPRTSNSVQDDKTQTGESSTSRSTGAVRDGITSPCAAELAKGKAIQAAACPVQMQPDAGPSVRAPAQHHDGVVAAIGGPAQANASDAASNAALAIPAFPQPDVNVAIAAIGGGVGGGVGGGGPVPAQINGGGIAVIAARPAPAAIPVPVLPPNPGVHNIDSLLTDSGIRPLRNPADGDEGKLWDKLD